MHRLLLIFLFVIFVFNCHSQRTILKNPKIEFWKNKNATIELENYFYNQFLKNRYNKETLINLATYEFENKKYENVIAHLKIYDSITKNKSLQSYLLLGDSYKYLNDYFNAKEVYKNGLSLAKKLKNRIFIQNFNQKIESVSWAIENSIPNSNYYESELDKFNETSSLYTNFWIENEIVITAVQNSTKEYSLLSFNPFTKEKTRWETNFDTLHIGSMTLANKNSNLIYYSLCNNDNKCLIYKGKIKEKKITDVSQVKGFNYSENSNITMPSFAFIENKSFLFFSAENNESKGGLDLFIGELITEDSIKEIQNLSYLNTESDDITPFYDSLSKTLYYSNSSMNGYGGFDIFSSEFSLTKKNKIKNIGRPLNSNYNDFYFNKTDSIITITSNRDKSNNCCNTYHHFIKVSNDNIISSLNEFKEPLSNFENTKATENLIVINNKNIDLIKNLFPIKIYFHNDIPNPKTTNTVTNVIYKKTFDDYIKMKEEYLLKNENTNSKEEIITFFDQELITGYDDLNELLFLVTEELQKGGKFKLLVKGFASPLASNNYNNALSKRRINSIINYIKVFNNGKLEPFLNNQLQIEEIPFGEEKAEVNTSDDPKLKRKSIYSIEAIHDRKIEIIGIEVSEIQNDSISLNQEIKYNSNVNLGQINNENVEVEFNILNQSNESIKIEKYTNNYEGLVFIDKVGTLEPKLTNTIKCKLNLKKIKGKFHFIIHLHSSKLSSPINLTIIGTH